MDPRKDIYVRDVPRPPDRQRRRRHPSAEPQAESPGAPPAVSGPDATGSAPPAPSLPRGTAGSFYSAGGAVPSLRQVHQTDREVQAEAREARRRHRLTRRLQKLLTAVGLVAICAVAVKLMLDLRQWGAPTGRAQEAAPAPVAAPPPSAPEPGAVTQPPGLLPASGFSAESERTRIERLRDALDYTRLGVEAISKSDYDGAFRNLGKALDLAPDFGDARYNIAKLYLERQDYQSALEHLARALEANPGMARYHLLAAVAFRRGGEFEPAELHARRALDIDPEIPEGHQTLAMSLLGLGEVHQAIPAFREAILRDRNNIALLNNLGVAQIRAGQIDEAIKTFRGIKGINENFQYAYQNLAALYARKDSAADAVAELDDALRKFGPGIVLLWLDHPDFDSIRTREEFLRFRRQLELTSTRGALQSGGREQPLIESPLRLSDEPPRSTGLPGTTAEPETPRAGVSSSGGGNAGPTE